MIKKYKAGILLRHNLRKYERSWYLLNHSVLCSSIAYLYVNIAVLHACILPKNNSQAPLVKLQALTNVPWNKKYIYPFIPSETSIIGIARRYCAGTLASRNYISPSCTFHNNIPENELTKMASAKSIMLSVRFVEAFQELIHTSWHMSYLATVNSSIIPGIGTAPTNQCRAKPYGKPPPGKHYCIFPFYCLYQQITICTLSVKTSSISSAASSRSSQPTWRAKKKENNTTTFGGTIRDVSVTSYQHRTHHHCIQSETQPVLRSASQARIQIYSQHKLGAAVPPPIRPRMTTLRVFFM